MTVQPDDAFFAVQQFLHAERHHPVARPRPTPDGLASTRPFRPNEKRMEIPPYKSSPGLARIGRALRYSLQGLRAAWRHEAAFRQEAVLCLCLAPVIVLVPTNLAGRAALAASLLFVLVVELLNSALEATVDRISPATHELSGRAKDFGSAAVMLALVLAGVVWTAVLVPIIW